MEMKNICGKIPVELHEKVKLEVEELGISIPKYLEMVIEEHIARKGRKDEHGRFKNSSSTGNRGFIFQTESSPRQERHETERLPDRTDRRSTQKMRKPNGKRNQQKLRNRKKSHPKRNWKKLSLQNQKRMKSRS